MVLITGVTGYIGSHLAFFFDKHKISYVGIDNLSCSYKSNIKKRNKVFITNISNIKKLNSLFKKYKISKVIHTAAYSYVIEAEKYKKKYYHNNIIQTKKFIDICKKKEIEHFVFLSSSNVYKEEEKHINGFKETDKLNPKNHYGQNKLEIEKYLISKNFKKLSILRLFNVIGIFNRNFKIFKFKKNNYQRIIFKLVQNIKKNQATNINYIYKNNKRIFPSRDFIGILELSKIIYFLIKKSNKLKYKIKILNVGSGKTTSILNIIKFIKKKINKKIKLNYNKMSDKELSSTKANINNLKKIINFKIKLDLKKSIYSNFNF